MKIDDLRGKAWKPTAFDKALHERIGRSYAGNTFLVIRQALRREMLLALLRIWDKSRGTVRLRDISKALRNQQTMELLTAPRPTDPPIPKYFEKEIRDHLQPTARDIIKIIEKYLPTSGKSPFPRLKALRNEQLAHRQFKATPVETHAQDDLDKEVEALYQDTSELVRLLWHLIMRTAFNPSEAAEVYAVYARHFWAGVSGEKTAGHPNFRAPPASV